MDRRDFLASKGTPHSVLLALVVEGPQTTAELSAYMSMEQRSVNRSLALLEGLGLVVKKKGRWALPAAVELSGKAGDSRDEDAREGKAGSRHAGNDADVARRAHDTRAARSSPPPPPGSTISWDRSKEEEEGRGNTPQAARDRNRVFRLLVEGGVGARSPKMKQLLELGLAPDYVEAFVAYRRERGDAYPVGHMIQALQCGDPAPAVSRGDQWGIPAEYMDVVVR